MNNFVKYLLFASSAAIFGGVEAGEPNPPTWDDKWVKIIDPSNSREGQAAVDAIFKENGGNGNHGQFSNSRYAVMFKRGYHNVHVKVGFYTHILGLGDVPQDVTINNLYCPNGDSNPHHGALDNFWRGAENFQVNSKVTWAVSQASPIRRMKINGDLYLSNGGYASGGFMADVVTSGSVNSGSQQQWMSRNSQWGRWVGGVWNMVFSGCNNAPRSHCSNKGGHPYSTINASPLIAEKPYISEHNGKYTLNVPHVEVNKVGPTPGFKNSAQVDFSQVFVANQGHTAQQITEKLDAGLNVVLQPGNYHLTDSIKVNKANTVVLGIGMATLISTTGKPCIEVGDVDGVRIAGVLLQAGKTDTDALLKWGSDNGAHPGTAQAPGVMSDVFARVGGPNDQHAYQVTAANMVVINSGNVIIDNTWLWRADHDVHGSVVNKNNPVRTGALINGDNVLAYGLAVEHTLGDMVIWNGNKGQTIFYQSEYPYDVTSDYAAKKHAAYKVGDHVTEHTAHGVGVYSFFRDHDVRMNSGIQAPKTAGVTFVNSFTVFLNGKGSIEHVINDQGRGVRRGAQLSYLCNYGSSEEEAQETTFLQ